MNSTPTADLAPPRFETHNPMLIAGLVERHDCQSPAGIPNQWQHFSPYIGIIPGQVGKSAYGVIFNFDSDSNFDYLSGVEVANASDLPTGITSLEIAGRNTPSLYTEAISLAFATQLRRSGTKGFPSRAVRSSPRRRLNDTVRNSIR